MKWKTLNPGDSIEVIAPGFRCSREDIQQGVRFIESLGFRAKVPRDILKPHYLCSSPVETRWKHLKLALQARDSKAIWCLRGGYGSLHLLPYLMKLRTPQRVKLLIGYSDITSLHHYLNHFWNWPTLHGPVLDHLNVKSTELKEKKLLQNILSGKIKELSSQRLKPMNEKASKNQMLRGTVVGGNLVTLASTLGTPYQKSARGKIVVFEEVGERAYRIDRLLHQFEQANFFQGCRAVVFGDFTDCEEADGSALWKKVLKDFAQRSRVPVLKGLKVGHGDVQWPLPLNTPASLSLGNSSKLVVSTGC